MFSILAPLYSYTTLTTFLHDQNGKSKGERHIRELWCEMALIWSTLHLQLKIRPWRSAWQNWHRHWDNILPPPCYHFFPTYIMTYAEISRCKASVFIQACFSHAHDRTTHAKSLYHLVFNVHTSALSCTYDFTVRQLTSAIIYSYKITHVNNIINHKDADIRQHNKQYTYLWNDGHVSSCHIPHMHRAVAGKSYQRFHSTIDWISLLINVTL